MQYQFLNIFLDQKELLAQSKTTINAPINPFLLENNSDQIESIYNFYKNNSSLLYINGFLGTGKAKIVDYSLAFLSTETIVLKYNCFNSTVLDDILLSFFNEFKKLVAQNIISEPKVKTENFTQKVNSYFTQVEKPFVIILNSFEAILDENRKEILDFIFHLSSIQKIKIIVTARTFESKYFPGVSLERVSLFALDMPIFEKYLKAEKIKFSNQHLEEFYKHTRGYYFFTAVSLKLVKSQNISLQDFLTNLRDSFLSFTDFLEKQISTLVPPTYRNLYWFLSMIRHPISVDLLKILNLYDEEKINFLSEYFIVNNDDNLVYVQDYFKEQLDVSMAPNIAQKIHRYIIDLYQSQLPLKPLERNILISRQTMRKEIEYHTLFLPKTFKNVDNSALGVGYLSYSKGLDFSGKDKTDEVHEEKKPVSAPVDLTQRKNININLDNLPLQAGAQSAVSKPGSGATPSRDIAEEVVDENLGLKELLRYIKRAELDYQYARAIDLCKKALLMTQDEKYQTYLPMIYTKMAHAYKKIADYENSLKYYELAREFYNNRKNFTKASYIKLYISRIFYDTYKLDKSKEMLLEIVGQADNPPILKTKAYLQLANLAEGLSNTDEAFNYYRRAIETSDESMDVKTLSELYFKYALVLDDKNDVKSALDFYNKCISLKDEKVNKFLSPAYTNIATLYLEKSDIQEALENYAKAYEIDKKCNNIEGMYYSASKLASILQRKQPDKALEYFNIALDCAKLTKDVFYIASAALALGDYYYERKQNEFALKNYLYAFDLTKDNFGQDNINKINVRLNDIKFRMGVEKFEELVEIIKEQENE